MADGAQEKLKRLRFLQLKKKKAEAEATERNRASLESDAAKLEAIPGAIGGAAVGIAEAVNPLQIPRAVETLGRAGYGAVMDDRGPEEGYLDFLGRQLGEASASAVSPDLSIRRIAPDVRTGITKAIEEGLDLATGQDLARPYLDIQKEEIKSQEGLSNIPGFEAGEITGEIGTAAASLYPVLRQGPKYLTNLAKRFSKKSPQEIIKAEESLANQLNVGQQGKPYIDQAQVLQREILGEISPEIQDAIYKRSENVERLLNDPAASRNTQAVVLEIRNQIDDTEKLLGDMNGAFREVLASNNNPQFKTDGIASQIGKRINREKMSSGDQVLSNRELAKIGDYKELLAGRRPRFEQVLEDPQAAQLLKAQGKDPSVLQERSLTVGEVDEGFPYLRDAYWSEEIATRQLTAGDLVRIIDKADSDLDAFYKGRSGTKMQRKTLQMIGDIRRWADNALAEKYPAYKSVKTEYAGFKNVADNVRKKIDSPNAESFLANIYNKNKTEYRGQVEDLINYAKRSADRMVELSDEVRSGKQLVDDDVKDLVQNIREFSKTMKMEEGRAFLNEIADIKAAEALRTTKFGGQSDFPSDRINRLVQQHVKKREGVGQKIGATIGGLMSALSGQYMAAPLVAGGSAYLGGKVAAVGAQASALRKYDPYRIFSLIKKAKNPPPTLLKKIDDATQFRKDLGFEAGVRFLDEIALTPSEYQYLDRFIKNTPRLNLAPNVAEQIELNALERRGDEASLRNGLNDQIFGTKTANRPRLSGLEQTVIELSRTNESSLFNSKNNQTVLSDLTPAGRSLVIQSKDDLAGAQAFIMRNFPGLAEEANRLLEMGVEEWKVMNAIAREPGVIQKFEQNNQSFSYNPQIGIFENAEEEKAYLKRTIDNSNSSIKDAKRIKKYFEGEGL